MCFRGCLPYENGVESHQGGDVEDSVVHQGINQQPNQFFIAFANDILVEFVLFEVVDKSNFLLHRKVHDAEFGAGYFLEVGHLAFQVRHFGVMLFDMGDLYLFGDSFFFDLKVLPKILQFFV